MRQRVAVARRTLTTGAGAGAPHPDGESPYRWVILTAGALTAASFSGLHWGLPALGPALRDHYDLSLAAVGIVFTSLSLGVALTMYPWGVLTDRRGERFVLGVGLAGSSLALAGAAFAPAVGVLVAALLTAGMLGAGTTGAGGRAVMGWFGAGERAFAISIRQSSPVLGAATIALVLPHVADAGGLRACFLLLAGVAMGGAVVGVLFMRDPAAAKPAGHANVASAPMRDPRVWRLAIGCGMAMLAQGAYAGFLALFLHDERGFSASSAAAGLALAQVVTGMSRIGMGRLSDRVGARTRLIVLLSVGGGIALIAVGLLVNGPGIALYPFLLGSGILIAAWNGLGLTAAAEIAGYERAGASIGIVLTLMTLAFSASGLIFGVLVSATSWSVAYGLVGVVAIAAGFVLQPLVADERRRTPV